MPTFPAAKDDLFAYDVVIFGDADISYLSQSQLQNLVEFVTEKGGGVLFVAGELFNPLAYHGTPLELLLPIELSDARNPTAVGTTVERRSGRSSRSKDGRSPIFRFGDDEASSMQIWERSARAILVLRGPAEEAGGARAGGASERRSGPTASCRWSSTSSWARASRCSTRSTIHGAGDFVRATGTSAGSGSRRSGFWPGRGWSGSDRPRSRPTAGDISAGQPIQFRVRFPNAGAVHPRRAT